MHSFFGRIIPFFFLGIMLVIFVAGLILVSYILIIGAIVGLILFDIAWIRDLFVHKKENSSLFKKQGRTIDHDDSSRL